MHISISNLTKVFGETAALQDVTLEIPPGEIVAVVGANGAGKTTLFRSLSGIVAPDSGEIRYDKQLFRRDRLDLRRRYFFLPDTPQLFLEKTVVEHIGMVVGLYESQHAGIEQEILQLLRDFDLLPMVNTRLYKLSRGQKYKAALVPLLAVNPAVWIFDEPFASGVDPRGVAAIRRRAHAAAEQGRTIIYSTQIIEMAAKFSDRVCVLDNGRVEAFGPIADLRSQSPADSRLGELLHAVQS